MTNQLPGKIAIERTHDWLRVMRDGEVSMGMCYYVRSDLLNTGQTDEVIMEIIKVLELARDYVHCKAFDMPLPSVPASDIIDMANEAITILKGE